MKDTRSLRNLLLTTKTQWLVGIFKFSRLSFDSGYTLLEYTGDILGVYWGLYSRYTGGILGIYSGYTQGILGIVFLTKLFGEIFLKIIIFGVYLKSFNRCKL